VRSASVSGDTLSIQADFNTSTSVTVIGAPSSVTKLTINGKSSTSSSTSGSSGTTTAADVKVPLMKLQVPDLRALAWHALDSLPEVTAGYDDARWPAADHTTSNNTASPLAEPVSLYASDYGFNAGGALLFRGHFTARGSEATLYLRTQGGTAFGYSVWLGATHLGSFAGDGGNGDHEDTWDLPADALDEGGEYVVTVLLDNMGLDETGPDSTDMKNPRGILDYKLSSADGATTDLTWKITGNLGGEDYADPSRGPLNEGGLFAERQGYHLPGAPASAFSSSSSSSSTPYTGLSAPGVAFYAASLPLDYPSDEYDIPISFVFGNGTSSGGAYRAFLYVNGFQFGRFVNNLGPQAAFPVPEGILRYRGDNWVGVALWALDGGGAALGDLYLRVGPAVSTGRAKVEAVDADAWTERQGAY